MAIRNKDAYKKSIGTMDEIRKFCNENNINDFADLLEGIKDKPKWLKAVMKYGGWAAMRKYFYRKEIARKHKEAMKDAPPNNRRPKPVVCINNGMEFRSINAAAKWAGVAHTQMISDCCRGVINNVRGLRFRFKDKEEM